MVDGWLDLHLVGTVAHAMSRACRAHTFHDMEAIRADAMVGMWKAALTWRPDGRASFRTWAKAKMRGEILDRRRVAGWWNTRTIAMAMERGQKVKPLVNETDLETEDYVAFRSAPSREYDPAAAWAAVA